MDLDKLYRDKVFMYGVLDGRTSLEFLRSWFDYLPVRKVDMDDCVGFLRRLYIYEQTGVRMIWETSIHDFYVPYYQTFIDKRKDLDLKVAKELIMDFSIEVVFIFGAGGEE